MIHVVLQQIGPKTDAVRSLVPIQIGAVGVQLIVAYHRAPVVHVAKRGIAGDVENRETALPGVGAVGAGNLENIETNVLSKIWAGGVVVHSRGAVAGIQEDRRGDDIADTGAINIGMVVTGADAGVAGRAARICTQRLP